MHHVMAVLLWLVVIIVVNVVLIIIAVAVICICCKKYKKGSKIVDAEVQEQYVYASFITVTRM